MTQETDPSSDPTAVAISGSPSGPPKSAHLPERAAEGVASTAGSAGIGIYYEHPDWFRPLFAELDRRGTPYEKVHVGSHRFDPTADERPFDIVLNRMSPSAYLRGWGSAIFYTTQYLAHLRRLGVRVINGGDAWETEISKARQLTLLRELGLPHPRARVVHRAAELAAAAEGLRFPVVVKPNIGGSGAGIRLFQEPETLRREAGEIDLGLDGTVLVQEYIPAADDRIVRVEILDGRFLYAIRVYPDGSSFNLCPADVCQGVDGAELERRACALDAPRNGLRVEGYEPPAEVIDAVERIASASEVELGGVEYMVDARDGALLYYDVNALSNFVADGERVVGFDPFSRLVDWLERELEAARGGTRPAPDGPGLAASAAGVRSGGSHRHGEAPMGFPAGISKEGL